MSAPPPRVITLAGLPAATDLEPELAALRQQFVGRLWKSLAGVALIGAPLSVSRAFDTGWLPVYSVHLAALAVILLVAWQRERLSYPTQVNLYLGVLWFIGLPGLVTFGLAASSIWWLVLSCFVAARAYSIRAGLLLAGAAFAALTLAGAGFVSGVLRLQVDAASYFTDVSSWLTLLVSTGAFMVTVLYSTSAHHHSLLRLMDEVKAQRDQIQQLATHDSLTGLPVLRLTNDRVTMAFARARRCGRKVALLFLDLDRFKAINDTHGHEAGDAVLCEVARRLGAALRAEDTVSRIGGDEFLIALTNIADVLIAEAVAAKLVTAIAEPIEHRGLTLRVGASIGISVFPDHGEDYAGLRHLADQAMYAAKHRGREGYALASRPVMSPNPHRQRRQRWVNG